MTYNLIAIAKELGIDDATLYQVVSAHQADE